jgi:hypothetical protein
MPVMNAKDRVKKGEIKVQDIPYMQRLGSWDNSDVKGYVSSLVSVVFFLCPSSFSSLFVCLVVSNSVVHTHSLSLV